MKNKIAFALFFIMFGIMLLVVVDTYDYDSNKNECDEWSMIGDWACK